MFRFGVLFLLVVLAGLVGGLNVEDVETRLATSIADAVTYAKPLQPGQMADVAYILGSSQATLAPKFQTAARTYLAGKVREVWIHGRPGITEYDSAIGRNMTNDEWSIRELERLGVASSKIKVIRVPQQYFGTHAEARSVSALVRSSELKSVLLIAQLHHTRRAYAAFSRLMPKAVSLSVYHSDDGVGVVEGLVELTKLVAYEVLFAHRKDETALGSSEQMNP